MFETVTHPIGQCLLYQVFLYNKHMCLRWTRMFLLCCIILLGNNIYGSEICQVLEGVKDSTERMAYILMDKINPTPVQNYLLRRDAPIRISNCVSELGVFGVYVR